MCTNIHKQILIGGTIPQATMVYFLFQCLPAFEYPRNVTISYFIFLFFPVIFARIFLSSL